VAKMTREQAAALRMFRRWTPDERRHAKDVAHFTDACRKNAEVVLEREGFRFQDGELYEKRLANPKRRGALRELL
jgi:hypothetical protein